MKYRSQKEAMLGTHFTMNIMNEHLKKEECGKTSLENPPSKYNVEK
jgi:hypothetical protein